MMRENLKYMMAAFMAVAMVCWLNGCGDISNHEDIEQIVTEAGDKQTAVETENEQFADNVKDEHIVERDSSGENDEIKTTPSKEHNDAESAASGGDLDAVVPNAADNDWYMKGSIYTDDKGNRLEVFFNDYGALQFAVNGLTLYSTTADNFQQENNWKIYTCDDDTMIIFYPGEPAHLEISDGDYAGLYEASGDT